MPLDKEIPELTQMPAVIATDLFVMIDGFAVGDVVKKAPGSVVSIYLDTLYQPLDTGLTDIAGIAVTNDNFIVGDGANWVAESGVTARTSLGLGSIATQAANSVSITGGSITGITDLAIADGGTGASTAQAAIDTLTAVAGATDEHVLTKDTATGNAIFKVSAGGSSLPVADTQTIVKGSTDATKLIRFEVDGLTTGTTRVLTPPDADLTLAGLEIGNTFTAIQKIDVSSATALLIEDDGVKDNVLIVDTANGRLGIGTAPVNDLHILGSIFNPQMTCDSGSRAFDLYAGQSNVLLEFSNEGFYDLSSKPYASRGINDNSRVRHMRVLASTGNVGIGTDALSPTSRLHIIDVDAINNDITNIITIGHNNSAGGAPIVNFGTGLLFQGRSATVVDQNMARLASTWATATHATRKARGIWSVYDTAEREGLRIEASGSAPMLGVLGANAIARQVHIVDADGSLADITTKFNSLLAYLENFGFIATS